MTGFLVSLTFDFVGLLGFEGFWTLAFRLLPKGSRGGGSESLSETSELCSACLLFAGCRAPDGVDAFEAGFDDAGILLVGRLLEALVAGFGDLLTVRRVVSSSEELE